MKEHQWYECMQCWIRVEVDDLDVIPTNVIITTMMP